MSNTAMPEHRELDELCNQVDVDRLRLIGDNTFTVEWDADAKVTPSGSLVFFAQYLQTAGLLDRLCDHSPLAYTSNNAPKDRDVFGTAILSILMVANFNIPDSRLNIPAKPVVSTSEAITKVTVCFSTAVSFDPGTFPPTHVLPTK